MVPFNWIRIASIGSSEVVKEVRVKLTPPLMADRVKIDISITIISDIVIVPGDWVLSNVPTLC